MAARLFGPSGPVKLPIGCCAACALLQLRHLFVGLVLISPHISQRLGGLMRLRFLYRLLFVIAAQDLEQNFGLFVSLLQVIHFIVFTTIIVYLAFILYGCYNIYLR